MKETNEFNDGEYLDKLVDNYFNFNELFDDLLSGSKDINLNKTENPITEKLLNDNKLAKEINKEILEERAEFLNKYDSLSDEEKVEFTKNNAIKVNSHAKKTGQSTVFIDPKKGGEN